MTCPSGYTDHPATWRCYVVFAVAWVVDHIPEQLPIFCYRPLLWAIEKFDQ